MSPKKDFPSEDGNPESASSDSGKGAEDDGQVDRMVGGLVDHGQDLVHAAKSRSVVVAAVAIGAVAATAIGIKIAYDRRKSATLYNKAVSQLEDAKDTLIAAAAELPERSRAVLHRVTNR